MDGWMDGWSVNKGAGVRGERSASRQCEPSIDSIGKTQGCVVLVAGLLVCRLVQPACLVGCLDLENTHTVMDGSWTGRKM